MSAAPQEKIGFFRNVYETFLRPQPSKHLERLDAATQRLIDASKQLDETGKRLDKNVGQLNNIARDMRGGRGSSQRAKRK